MSDSNLPRRYIELAPRAPEGWFSLDALIAGDGPLELDIGFGRGLSLFERAEKAPDSRIVGIEVKSKLAHKVAQKVQRDGLSAVRVLCGDAKEILQRAGPDRAVQSAALHFPDPWWKKRHQKRRIVGDDLLGSLARLLRPGGQLFIQTDVEDRAHEYVQQVRETNVFVVQGEAGFVDENPLSARSNRERRAIEDGLPVWRIVATRM